MGTDGIRRMGTPTEGGRGAGVVGVEPLGDEIEKSAVLAIQDPPQGGTARLGNVDE